MKEIDNISPQHPIEPIQLEGGGHACTSSVKVLTPVNLTRVPYYCLQPSNLNASDFVFWTATGTTPGTNFTFTPNNATANPFDANMIVNNTSTALRNAEVKFTYAVPDRLGKPCKVEGRKTVSFGRYDRAPELSTRMPHGGPLCVGDQFFVHVSLNQPSPPINNSTTTVVINPNPNNYISFTQLNTNNIGNVNETGMISFLGQVNDAPSVRSTTINFTVHLRNECGEISAIDNFSISIKLCAVAINTNLTPVMGLMNVTERLSGFMTGSLTGNNWKAELIDDRQKTLAQTTIDASGLFSFDLLPLNLQTAKYTILAYNDSISVRPKDWYLLSSETSHLIVSPNPAVATIDKEVNAEVYNAGLSEPPYFVSFQSENGSIIDTFTTTEKYFTLNVKDLEAGNYPVVVTSADGATFSETIDLKLKGEPYLQIANNPVDQELNLSFLNPIAGTKDVNYLVVSSMGIIKNSGIFGNQTNLQLRLNVADYETGIYNVIVTDGYKNYSIQFIKL